MIRFQLYLVLLLLLTGACPLHGIPLEQISKDHAVYVHARQGTVLVIDIERRMGTDPDLIHIFGPDGTLQERLEIGAGTTIDVELRSGDGTYKILPVNHTCIHSYSVRGSGMAPVPMVVEPFDHLELVRVDGTADLYFKVPENTPSMTFHAHSMGASIEIQEHLYDPDGTLTHTFVLAPDTFQEDHTVIRPAPGFWRCRFVTPSYERCGCWLDGVPNYFSSIPAAWFRPEFQPAAARLTTDAAEVVSSGARIGVNWWIDPSYPASYQAELAAVLDAAMDTARLSVDWAWREPANDNDDPFVIDWTGFNFSGHDTRMAAYHDDVCSVIPFARPVLLFYWSPNVSWQSGNPAAWSETQREEYAEFVLATMIHTVAPDLQDPPDPGPAYDFTFFELINEPNLTMGSGQYQAYIDLVNAVGQRLIAHPDPRINTLKLLAPGIGWAWGQGNLEMENWIGKLIDQADAVLGGVNWHQYDYLRIEECHRYTEDIEKVIGWLETRGDGVADELIAMTETNQHGGPPTYWKRQDTFYASRWWAGTCLSALRGGVEFIHYYQLMDDPSYTRNFKGMMFNDGLYDPPLFPGGPPHGTKPVHAATSFINTHRRSQVIQSECDHPEIAQTATLSKDHSTVSILLANLFDRVIELALDVSVPPDMQDDEYQVTASRHGPSLGVADPVQVLPGSHHSSGLHARLRLSPRTLYAVTFERVESRNR